MSLDYWHKQTHDKPMYADLLWSRPENKQSAGKLLIIGGNLHGMAAPAEAYQEAAKAGAGLTRVLLPLSVKSLAGKLLETIDYAPSTPSGSFASAALAEWLDGAAWANGVLLPGDLGRNSETAIVLEKFLQKNTGSVVLAKDAADYVSATPAMVLGRPNTLLVLTIAQLQKLFSGTNQPVAITFGMDLLHLVDALHIFTSTYPIFIMVKHLNQVVVAVDGQISTTPIEGPEDAPWRVKTATHAAVWWLQNPAKAFKALTTSLLE